MKNPLSQQDTRCLDSSKAVVPIEPVGREHLSTLEDHLISRKVYALIFWGSRLLSPTLKKATCSASVKLLLRVVLNRVGGAPCLFSSLFLRASL